MGIQTFQTTMEGVITVEEIRSPIVIDGQRWITRLENFVSNTLLINKLKASEAREATRGKRKCHHTPAKQTKSQANLAQALYLRVHFLSSI